MSGRLALYRSPKWALVLDAYIAFQGIVMGAVGSMDSGALALTLHASGIHFLWSGMFVVLGTALFGIALLEMKCRHTDPVGCERFRGFAVIREWLNVGLVVPWGFGVLLYFVSNSELILVPVASAQALVVVFIIQWENVRAQKCRATERRNDARFGLRDGFSR
jgi:hypothetical protein